MPKKLNKIQNSLKIDKGDENVGRLDIAGEVGWDWYGDAWDAGYFKARMDDQGDVDRWDVHINSPGGSVIDGIAIFNYLAQHRAPVHVHIDGVAASIASVIAMAADKIHMPSNTLMFIHEPWMYTAGSAKELRKDAETLDQMKTALRASYMRHFKGTAQEIDYIMTGDTWLTASEVADKFRNVEVLDSEVQIAASLDLKKLGPEIPEQAKAFLGEEDEKQSFFEKLKAFFKSEGFSNTASALEAELADETETQEEEMTPEQEASIVAKVTEGVLAALKQDDKAPEEQAPKAEAPKIDFKGDPNSAEDVQAHIDAVNDAQLVAAVDWSDVNSVLAYQKAKFGAQAASAELPHGNVGTPAGSEASKEQDLEETRACFDKFM